MKKVNSQNLSAVDAMLGITGVGSQQTELDDGNLQQMIDVVPAARRGGTLGPTGGLFYGLMQNVHTDAESLTTTVFPFNMTTGLLAAYPSPLQPQFDLWIIAAGIRLESGGGTYISQLNYDQTALVQGWGLDDSGAAVTGISRVCLGVWDELLAGPGATIGLLENGDSLLKIGLRMSRQSSLRFAGTSSLTITMNCDVLFGLFPAATGQDVAV